MPNHRANLLINIPNRSLIEFLSCGQSVAIWNFENIASNIIRLMIDFVSNFIIQIMLVDKDLIIASLESFIFFEFLQLFV